VVDPDAGINIQQSLRKIMSIYQVIDPDAGANISEVSTKDNEHSSGGTRS
jgi:hypothetical protein